MTYKHTHMLDETGKESMFGVPMKIKKKIHCLVILRPFHDHRIVYHNLFFRIEVPINMSNNLPNKMGSFEFP